MQNLEDAGAVVTGAGHGIGRALASRLVAEGARVVVNDLDDDACRAVAEELGGTRGRRATAPPTPAYARSSTPPTEALGRIDVFMANAGIDRHRRPDSLQASDEDWARMIDTNVMAHVRAARAARPALARGRPGRPVRGHRVGRRAAHDDRQRAVLRHQARRGRLRRVALGDLRRTAASPSRPSARRACRPGCSSRPDRSRTCSPATPRSTPEQVADAWVAVAGRGPLPGPPPPRGRRLLRRPRRRHRPLAGRACAGCRARSTTARRRCR